MFIFKLSKIIDTNSFFLYSDNSFGLFIIIPSLVFNILAISSLKLLHIIGLLHIKYSDIFVGNEAFIDKFF